MATTLIAKRRKKQQWLQPQTKKQQSTGGKAYDDSIKYNSSGIASTMVQQAAKGVTTTVRAVAAGMAMVQ